MTPLGKPVVPEVYCILTTSYGETFRWISARSSSLTFSASLCRSVLQLRDKLVDDLHVIRIFQSFDHHQRVGVGLAQQVLGLEYFIVGVHSHQRGADLGGGVHKYDPFGVVGRPDGNVGAGLHTDSEEAPGNDVALVSELGVSLAEGFVVADHAVVVREDPGTAVQQIAKGHLYKGVFLFAEDLVC